MDKNLYEKYSDEYFMAIALDEALKATASGDVPIGAVIVRDNIIIGRGYNEVEKTKNSTAHAEMIAINNAIESTGYKHLPDTRIYVTLEPCAMCSGAIVLARIPTLIYGADDPKAGASGSLFTITSDSRLNHRCEIISGVLKEECSVLIKDFFADLRKVKSNNEGG